MPGYQQKHNCHSFRKEGSEIQLKCMGNPEFSVFDISNQSLVIDPRLRKYLSKDEDQVWIETPAHAPFEVIQKGTEIILRRQR